MLNVRKRRVTKDPIGLKLSRKMQSKRRSAADYGTEIRGVHIELAVVNRFALSVLHPAVCQLHNPNVMSSIGNENSTILSVCDRQIQYCIWCCAVPLGRLLNGKYALGAIPQC